MNIRTISLHSICLCISTIAAFAAQHNLPIDYQKKLLVPEPILEKSNPVKEDQVQQIEALKLDFYLGDSLFLQGDLKHACFFYSNAIEIAVQLNLPWTKIICQNRLGFTYYWLNDIESSNNAYLKSVVDISNSVQIEDSLAALEAFLLFDVLQDNLSGNHLDEYIGSYILPVITEKSFVNSTRKLKYHFLNECYTFYDGNYRRMKENILESQSYFGKLDGPLKLWYFFNDYYLAIYYSSIEDYPLSIQYFTELENQVEENRALLPYKYFVYLNECRMYSDSRNFVKAGKYIDKITGLIKGKNKPYYSYDHLLIGYVYQNLGFNKTAFANYQLAESVLTSNGIQDERLALVCWYMALYYQYITFNNEKTIYYLNRAQKILETIDAPYLKSFIIRALGDHYINKDDEKAISVYNKVLYDVHKLLTDELYFQEHFHYIARTDYINLLTQRGTAYSNLAEKENSRLEMLTNSYYSYYYALKLSQKIFDQAGFEDSKLSYLSAMRLRYERVFNAGYSLFEFAGADSLLQVLFRFSENSKAYLLKNYLSDETIKQLSGVPEEEIAKGKKIQKDLDTLRYALGLRSVNIKEIGNKFLIDEIIAKTKEYQEYINNLETRYPKYNSMKRNRRSISLSQLQTKIDSTQILLEYFFTSGSFYTFYISKDTSGLYYAPINSTFPTDLLAYWKEVGNFNFTSCDSKKVLEFAQHSYKLYQLLIQPFESLIHDKRLLIVTDAELGYIPFETLITGEPDSTKSLSYAYLPYLLYKNPVSYLFSASQILDEQKSKHPKVRFAGFAPSYPGNSDSLLFSATAGVKLDQLPGAREEILSLDRYYRGKSYIGADATKVKFFQEIRNKEIIHLAMHALLNENDPHKSLLLFSPSIEQDKLQLHTYEVYSAKIRTSLVVLSACNTGNGKINKGEGIFSIARSFLLAGIKNVIYTQWAVTDKSGAQLMDNFYEFLSEGDPVDIALQKSKINFITGGDPMKAHPYYWAGYINMGNPLIMLSDKRHTMIYVALISGVLLLLILWIRKKSATSFFSK
jgi:CHAT domain-containing protein